jgi:hypothetical protein
VNFHHGLTGATCSYRLRKIRAPSTIAAKWDTAPKEYTVD